MNEASRHKVRCQIYADAKSEKPGESSQSTPHTVEEGDFAQLELITLEPVCPGVS